MTDQSLSEKVEIQPEDDYWVIPFDDVKQAIQEFLKEVDETIKADIFIGNMPRTQLRVKEIIDALAKEKFGDKLLEAEK